jgi:hypothetical protein
MMKRWFGGGPQTDAEVTLLFKWENLLPLFFAINFPEIFIEDLRKLSHSTTFL